MYSWPFGFNRPVHSSLTCTSLPSVEPISLDTAKAQCRVEIDDDDTLITSLITAARRYAEVYQRRAFITSTWSYTLDWFPIYSMNCFVPGEIKLPVPPVQSVSSLQYYDPSGTLQTYDPSLYVVDLTSQQARIIPLYGTPWPLTNLYRPNSVIVSFVAGYGDSGSSVPQTTIQAMLMLIAYWYAQRESVADVSLTEAPQAVEMLLMAEHPGNIV